MLLPLLEIDRGRPARARARARRRCRCSRARTASRRRRRRSARRSRTSYARLERQIAAFARCADQGQDERRRRQLQRARRSPIRTSTGRRFAAKDRREPRARVQSVHDADRAARLHRRVLRRARAREHDPDRPRPRHLGLRRRSAISGSGCAKARSARRRCRTRSIRSTSRIPKATSASRMRCCAISPRSCRSRAGSAT